MKKTLLIGLMAAIGAFAGVVVVGSRLQAAEEVRCRVNVEAMLKDLIALNRAPDVDAEFVRKLLQPKPETPTSKEKQ